MGPVKNEDLRHDEVSLKQIILKVQKCFKYLLSKWYIILAVVVAGCIAGYLYSSKKKVLYTAVCTFVVEGGQPSQQLTGIAALLSGSATSGGEGLFQGGTLLSLYTTRLMIEKTLFSQVVLNNRKVLLMDWYLKINNEGESWSKVPKKERAGKISGIISKIATDYVTVEPGNFVTVKVKTPDELFSKHFNEKLIETVNRFYVQTKTKKSLTALRILERQADSLRRIMTISMTGAAVAVDAYPNANPARRVLGVPAQKRAVDVQATTSLYSGVVASLESTKMELRKETPLIQIIDRPALPLSKNVPDIKRGIAMGGIAGGAAAVFLLLLQLFYSKIMSDESV